MNQQFPELVPRLESYATIKTWRERHGRYRMLGSRCKKCSEIWFPSRDALICPKCQSREFIPYECARTGEVLTVQHEIMGYPAMGYGELSPRKIVMIKLDDGVTIISEVVDCAAEEVKPGTKVKMAFRKHKREENGCWMYGYKFVLNK